MLKVSALTFSILLLGMVSHSQQPIDVAESTLKVSAMTEEVFYYGFAEGDQLIFNFTEVNGKELKELEITELPSSSKFMDFKTKKIDSKVLTMARTGIYKFRFTNGAITGRICKFRLQRIPASSATQNFNTSVFWKTVSDTTNTPVEQRYIQSSDTIISQPLDVIAKISSQTAINGNSNRRIVDFMLPENTVSWSYYIGVGTEGKQAYEASKDKFVSNAASAVAGISGYGTMAALALYGLNTFGKVQGRDNVKYYFIADSQNAALFDNRSAFYQYKQGDVINDASQMKFPLSGKIYLGLENDNVMEPIEVIIKATAVQINQLWATRIINQMSVATRQVAYLKN